MLLLSAEATADGGGFVAGFGAGLGAVVGLGATVGFGAVTGLDIALPCYHTSYSNYKLSIHVYI